METRGNDDDQNKFEEILSTLEATTFEMFQQAIEFKNCKEFLKFKEIFNSLKQNYDKLAYIFNQFQPNVSVPNEEFSNLSNMKTFFYTEPCLKPGNSRIQKDSYEDALEKHLKRDVYSIVQQFQSAQALNTQTLEYFKSQAQLQDLSWGEVCQIVRSSELSGEFSYDISQFNSGLLRSQKKILKELLHLVEKKESFFSSQSKHQIKTQSLSALTYGKLSTDFSDFQPQSSNISRSEEQKREKSVLKSYVSKDLESLEKMVITSSEASNKFSYGMAILASNQNRLYMRLHNGLLGVVDLKTQEYKQVPFEDSLFILSACEYKEQYIFVCTQKTAINVLDLKNDFKHVGTFETSSLQPESKMVVLQDGVLVARKNGDIELITQKLIQASEITQFESTHIYTVKNHKIMCVDVCQEKDQKQIIALGTDTGIVFLEKQEPKAYQIVKKFMKSHIYTQKGDIMLKSFQVTSILKLQNMQFLACVQDKPGDFAVVINLQNQSTKKIQLQEYKHEDFFELTSCIPSFGLNWDKFFLGKGKGLLVLHNLNDKEILIDRKVGSFESCYYQTVACYQPDKNVFVIYQVERNNQQYQLVMRKATLK